jgi:queuine tRNA-ribosyltransferase
MAFKILKQSKINHARLGELKTRRGVIKTPFFMPIATKAAVKSLTYEDLKKLDPGILLSNTYHLMIRPGEKLIKKAGDLHAFMNWDKSILTDSGGFQVFSLSKMRKITDAGVEFRSHLDGKKYFMRPEDSIKIQLALGSDIIMVLDECVELPAKREYLEKSVDMTTEWASRCRKYFDKTIKKTAKKPLLFGIVQGGTEQDLRLKSARDLVKLNFDGYAVGGLAVGEAEQEMYSVLDYLVKELPENKPRYLMGVGRPENIIEAVKRGIDMFDCVIPTREARHGRLYLPNPRIKNVFKSPKKSYQQVNIKLQKYATDFSPINKDSQFDVLKNYSKAYLRHLFATQEPLALRLATLNNLEFYLGLMEKIRKEI